MTGDRTRRFRADMRARKVRDRSVFRILHESQLLFYHGAKPDLMTVETSLVARP